MKFSIRNALLGTAIVALCIGWWLDRRALAYERARADLWEYRAGAVCDWVSGEGWKVVWTASGVEMSRPGGSIDEPWPVNH
jgi:hypothetical protein